MIITGLYLNMFGTKFGGRYKSFKNRYLTGLANLSGNSQKKIVYVKPDDFNEVKNFLSKKLKNEELNLYHLIPFDLKNQTYHNDIQRLKTENGYLDDRCLEIQYGKLQWMLNHIDEDDYVWWIDAGLVCTHLFPLKYSEDFNNAKKIFNDEYFKKLEERINKKVYFICGDRKRYYAHGAPLEKYFEKNYQNRYHPIGGFFGGYHTSLKTFLNKTNDKIKLVLDDNRLNSEEMIMEITFSEDIDNHVYDDFTTWRHEDSGDFVKLDENSKKDFINKHRPFYCNFIHNEYGRNSEVFLKND